MDHTRLRKALIAVALVSATAFGASALVGAQQGGYGYGMGPGMMGGYGPGAGGGGMGPGYGMGPGMMGGYGPGGGYGMGPGMMGGFGPGMMGGHGHGMMGGFDPGMMGGGMGYGMLYHLNLAPDQWNKLNAIQEDLAKKQWDLTGKVREESYKLRGLMALEKRDRGAIIGQYKKVQELRLQGFQARVESQEKIDAVLTKEQRAQLRRFAPWWGQDIE